MLERIRVLFATYLRKWNNNPDCEAIAESESVVRYLISKSQFNSTIVKPAAFMPRPDPNFGLSTSVFRSSKMTSIEDVETRKAFEAIAGKKIKALATLSVQDIKSADIEVSETKLDIVPEETDFKWHADVIKWPQEKAEQKLFAIELAKASKLEK